MQGSGNYWRWWVVYTASTPLDYLKRKGQSVGATFGSIQQTRSLIIWINVGPGTVGGPRSIPISSKRDNVSFFLNKTKLFKLVRRGHKIEWFGVSRWGEVLTCRVILNRGTGTECNLPSVTRLTLLAGWGVNFFRCKHLDHCFNRLKETRWIYNKSTFFCINKL